MRLHVDTDLGDNPDDACALAMLLRWPDAEVVAVTTVADKSGARVPLVEEILTLAGRAGVPVVGETSGAVDRIAESIDAGAAVVALGPLSNLAALERRSPGALSAGRLTVSGGWLDGPGPGLPAWTPTRDSNVTTDPDAARVVWSASSPGGSTWVPVPVSARATLRTDELERLAAGGPLGRRLADLTREHAARRGYRPPLANYLFDPVAAAVAVGWSGATIESVDVRWAAAEPPTEGCWFERGHRPGVRTTRIVTRISGNPLDILMRN